MGPARSSATLDLTSPHDSWQFVAKSRSRQASPPTWTLCRPRPGLSQLRIRDWSRSVHESCGLCLPSARLRNFFRSELCLNGTSNSARRHSRDRICSASAVPEPPRHSRCRPHQPSWNARKRPVDSRFCMSCQGRCLGREPQRFARRDTRSQWLNDSIGAASSWMRTSLKLCSKGLSRHRCSRQGCATLGLWCPMDHDGLPAA